MNEWESTENDDSVFEARGVTDGRDEEDDYDGADRGCEVEVGRRSHEDDHAQTDRDLVTATMTLRTTTAKTNRRNDEGFLAARTQARQEAQDAA